MRRDAPARRRGVRLAGKVFFGGGVPAPDDERRHSALAGAELQAARCIQRNAGDFTDDRSQALAFQALFHRGQYVAVLPGLAVDDSVMIEADTRERRRKEIAPA